MVKNIGRNDPCSCGSGNKYKKCCLGTDKDPFSKDRQNIVKCSICERSFDRSLSGTFQSKVITRAAGVQSIRRDRRFHRDGECGHHSPSGYIWYPTRFALCRRQRQSFQQDCACSQHSPDRNSKLSARTLRNARRLPHFPARQDSGSHRLPHRRGAW